MSFVLNLRGRYVPSRGSVLASKLLSYSKFGLFRLDSNRKKLA